jgi:hypothetical protein
MLKRGRVDFGSERVPHSGSYRQQIALQQKKDEMRLSWRIAAFGACLATICGTVTLWHIHSKKASTQRAAEDALAYRLAADQGDPKSEYNLGDIYYHGQGVHQDYTEAFHWFSSAADQGDPEAQYALGYMYYHGQAVAKNYSEAMRWYRNAADRGQPKAQYDLGSMYYYGQGVPKDYDQAIRWYRNAADQGYARAQYALGSMYYNGVGLPQDYVEADRWLGKAADQGDAMARRALGQRETRSNAWINVRYTLLFLALIVSVSFLTDYLLPGRNRRDRGQQVTALLGLLGVLYVGLSLYGITHDDMRDSAHINAFYLAKWLLVGMSIVFAFLWLGDRKKQREKELR